MAEVYKDRLFTPAGEVCDHIYGCDLRLINDRVVWGNRIKDIRECGRTYSYRHEIYFPEIEKLTDPSKISSPIPSDISSRRRYVARPNRGPVLSRFAAGCTLGFFWTEESPYLFHITKNIAESYDSLAQYIMGKCGISPEDIKGGVYTSSGVTMISGVNTVYNRLKLTPIHMPLCVGSIDIAVDLDCRLIQMHPNYVSDDNKMPI